MRAHAQEAAGAAHAGRVAKEFEAVVEVPRRLRAQVHTAAGRSVVRGVQSSSMVKQTTIASALDPAAGAHRCDGTKGE